MGFFKKLNKAVNKVGKAASKAVSGVAGVVSKVGNIPGANLIPGFGTVANIAKTAGKVAQGVGNVIASGQSRGGSPPAMASPQLQLAPQTASSLVSGSGNVKIGNTSIDFSTGNNTAQAQAEKPKSWFEKNKIVVFVSSALAVLVGLFVALRPKGRGSRRR